jgi:hypothetical protein
MSDNPAKCEYKPGVKVQTMVNTEKTNVEILVGVAVVDYLDALYKAIIARTDDIR